MTSQRDVDHANPQSGNCTVAKPAAMCADRWLFVGVPSPKDEIEGPTGVDCLWLKGDKISDLRT